MAVYLSTDQSQTQSPISATPGLRSGSVSIPRIYDRLYEVMHNQYQTPVLQTLAWGYSTFPRPEIQIDLPEVAPWLAVDYPFVAPSEDIQGLVVDIYFSFDDPLHKYQAPIRLTRLSKHGPDLYSVCFNDATGKVIFDSVTYKYTSDSIAVEGDTYEEKAKNRKGNCVYKHYDTGWEVDDTTLYELLYWETELVTLKMTIRRVDLPQYYILPDSAELDARALYQYPDRLRSITVVNKDRDTREPIISGIIAGGSVRIQEGYNISYSCESYSDIRTSNIISMTAQAGAGAGLAPYGYNWSTDPQNPLLTVNGVEPLNGNLFIIADAGHTVRGTSAVSLGNDNRPCCDCADMSELGRLINTVEDEYYCMGAQYTQAARDYIKQVSKLQERVEKEAEEIPQYEYHLIEGNRLFASFTLVFRNLLPTCINNLRIHVKAEHVTILKERTSQTGPVAKEYSDCYVIDTLPKLQIIELEGKINEEAPEEMGIREGIPPRDEEELEAELDANEDMESSLDILELEESEEAPGIAVEDEDEDKEYEKREKLGFIAYWDRPIASGQQVYVRGFYRLNTHYQEYDSYIKAITYTSDCGEEIALDLSKEPHQSVNYGPYDHMEFMDFTDLLTNKELDHLEDEIRERSRKDGIDIGFRRNTVNTGVKDESESEETEDSQSVNNNNNNNNEEGGYASADI